MSCLFAVSFGIVSVLTGSSSLIAKDVIRAGDAVTESNVTTETGFLDADDEALLGREVRRTVYAGQPIKPENTRSRRLVTRNQTVPVKYVDGMLEITISGRAMSEAGEGEPVEVMNLETRQLIRGIVTKDGWILAQ